jgi:hypothetical protein
MKKLTRSLLPAISEISAWVAFNLRESFPVSHFNSVREKNRSVDEALLNQSVGS